MPMATPSPTSMSSATPAPGHRDQCDRAVVSGCPERWLPWEQPGRVSGPMCRTPGRPPTSPSAHRTWIFRRPSKRTHAGRSSRRPIGEAATDLMHRVYADFTYKSGSTTLSTKVGQLLRQRTGVCQDYAHFMVAGLRSLGLGGRYVSGLSRHPPAARPTATDRCRRQPRLGRLLGARRRVAAISTRRTTGCATIRMPRSPGDATTAMCTGSWRDLHRGQEVEHGSQRRHGAGRLTGWLNLARRRRRPAWPAIGPPPPRDRSPEDGQRSGRELLVHSRPVGRTMIADGEKLDQVGNAGCMAEDQHRGRRVGQLRMIDVSSGTHAW